MKKGSKWSIIIAILVCALTIPASYYYRGEVSLKWIIGRIIFVLCVAVAFESFQKYQREKNKANIN